jgi:phospholipase A1/A2
MKNNIWAITTLLASTGLAAQTNPSVCASIVDSSTRLACYDNWAQRQDALLPKAQGTPLVQGQNTPTPSSSGSQAAPASTGAGAGTAAASPAQLPLANTPALNPEAPAASLTPAQRAATQPSEITRFWDLEHASAREALEIRGYRPISLAVTTANNVNSQPNSPSNAQPSTATDFNSSELKINLSVRTKIASGLLRRGDDALRDSIWFGYSQQSYWQLFNSAISRPFRVTDHEPELIYVYPHALALPGGWTYRMTGTGLVHQSNGQSKPLSRSWNRAYVMAAADKIASNGDRFTLQARVWDRISERADKDDNPDISNFIGRAELAGRWSFDTGAGIDKTAHTLGLTVRHALKSQGRGSVKLEYLRSLGSTNSGLRFHTQLFSGYGDSLIDYNVKRTVLSVGLSLVDW